MSIITLTTDFGTKDYFVGVIKAQIHQVIPSIKIIDLSHQIDPFNHAEASYILSSSIKFFPEKSIHLIGVDSQSSDLNNHILVVYNKQYFISANNGIMSLVIKENTDFEVYEFKCQKTENVLECFIKIAAKIHQKIPLTSIGKKTNRLIPIQIINPIISHQNSQILTSVIYIDGLENLVFNITKSQFFEVSQNRPFRIMTSPKPITKIYDSYGAALDQYNGDIKRLEGTKVAIFNEADYLEIGIFLGTPNKTGSAHSLSGLNYFDTLKIIFD